MEGVNDGHTLCGEAVLEGSKKMMYNGSESSDSSVEGLGAIDLDDSEAPMVGMLFQDLDEVFGYYKRNGQRKGFSVKRRTVNKDKAGMIKYVTFTCGRSDKCISKSENFVNPRSNAKNECKARMSARIAKDGKWEISKFLDVHNHAMSPTQSRYFSCNRDINTHVKRQLEINDIAGIRPNKSHNAQVIGAGGHENLHFLEQDTRNLLVKVRRLRLGEGDANAIQSYFMKMQSHNDEFFSLTDWDDNGRLKNVFWADPRSRAACREFGDVITFDTTYLTNKYDMPFAPFLGVNHHGQSILLGCGLICNEDTDTFIWLFSAWLACMHNVYPVGIITNQDRAMKNAIVVVFPKTRHRLCLWHILKKVPEKLGSYNEYEQITYALGEVVYESQSTMEFEGSWNMMIENFNLQGNSWLGTMYAEREMWVPIYVKNFFWTGMSTTQRSESINAFFDGYVSSTTLKQFVEQYNNALRNKAEKESVTDFNSYHKHLNCATSYLMEKQMLDLYTESKFKEFQKELTGLLYGMIKSVMRNDMFEFRGILCRHALTVLIRNGEEKIPPHYIFRRWRKDIRRYHTRVKVHYKGMKITADQQRYDEMYSLFTKLADLAANNVDNYNYITQWIEDATTKMNVSHVVAFTPGSSSNDPIPKRGKGRPPSLRKKKIFKKKRLQPGTPIQCTNGNLDSSNMG
ncbi:protein FAR-RED IMPAIRED RESPONSE 1-like [Tripterygium wilfordii]|uniref:protein FAR-RED IMPAIRED RESPONSE 1-like n=1 Tax=Tripterygium wilfordii TaxID=458696 RepID=UPI0018F8532C|nr:protein FAR-RED IMPAIRED RESPONSE 1-like [Tripterygium wilfordii]